MSLVSKAAGQNGAGTVPLKNFRKAVREVREMKKNDPAAYEAMVKRYANTIVRIVPG